MTNFIPLRVFITLLFVGFGAMIAIAERMGMDILEAQMSVAQFSNDPLYFALGREIATRNLIQSVTAVIVFVLLAITWMPVIIEYIKKDSRKDEED